MNDGLSFERGAAGGAAIWVGIVNFDGSSAVSVIVSVTSSEVLTSPATEIGPMPEVDIFTCAVAVSVSFPSATVAVGLPRDGLGSVLHASAGCRS